jgi:saposin
MKIQIFISLVAFFALTSGVFVPPRPGHKRLINSKECTWGPTYWCQNLTTAANCRAVKHCIQTVWIHKELPPDSSSVCQTCLDMVKQARDQLESNETQELIKEVFEGSCALLHFKTIVKECDKIADEYIPELVDTLASEMNPQVVCSVAGLCNNEKIDKLIAEEKANNKQPETLGTCDGCHTVVEIMEDKFNKMSRDEVLQGFLEICGKTGSLSDGCSNIIITYFTEIYNHLKENLNPNDFCLMTGECSAKFHTHAKVEITPISHIGYVPVAGSQKDDLPCEFCEQLVSHLRDLLVANTTVDEFKRVLEGLCKQTKSFSAECLSLVDEYYAVAYNFLVSELNSNAVCVLAGICPNNGTRQQAAIIPLLPVQTAQIALEITPAPTQKPLIRINMGKDSSSVKIMESPEQAQLPIDRLMPPHSQLYNSETCVFCEYFLHYLQQAITDPATEEEIKAVIDKACSKLPRSINSTCIEFVNTYEPALVAILAQEIDPSQVCPLIRACPSADVQEVEVFMHQESDGSKCPLCLFAVSKLEEMVKDKKTEENIKSALNKLCERLPTNLAAECDDFVNTYTDELVELLLADLTPQEVCVYLKLCSDSQPATGIIGGDPSTNTILDYTINGRDVQQSPIVNNNAQCIICEFVMKEIQDQLKDNKTEEDIIKTVHDICNYMPRSVSKECNDFVDEYGDTVIQLLIAATVPSEICRMLHLCSDQIAEVKVEIFECAICETLVYAMEKILANPKVDHNVEHVLEKACRALPHKDQSKCIEITKKYGVTIYNLIIHLADKGLVCREIGLCANKVARPNRSLLVGDNKCTWGPSYWCASKENAENCGDGAKKHCQEKVWLTQGRTKRGTSPSN